MKTNPHVLREVNAIQDIMGYARATEWPTNRVGFTFVVFSPEQHAKARPHVAKLKLLGVEVIGWKDDS